MGAETGPSRDKGASASRRRPGVGAGAPRSLSCRAEPAVRAPGSHGAPRARPVFTRTLALLQQIQCEFRERNRGVHGRLCAAVSCPQTPSTGAATREESPRGRRQVGSRCDRAVKPWPLSWAQRRRRAPPPTCVGPRSPSSEAAGSQRTVHVPAGRPAGAPWKVWPWGFLFLFHKTSSQLGITGEALGAVGRAGKERKEIPGTETACREAQRRGSTIAIIAKKPHVHDTGWALVHSPSFHATATY